MPDGEECLVDRTVRHGDCKSLPCAQKVCWFEPISKEEYEAAKKGEIEGPCFAIIFMQDGAYNRFAGRQSLHAKATAKENPMKK